MTTIFTFRVDDKLFPESDISKFAGGLVYQKDFRDYLLENKGKELKAEFSPAVKMREKQAMYDYYHKVVLQVAIQVFTNEGWESMDKVKADHFLKMECAKGMVYNVRMDRQEIYLEEKSKMNKDRLHKFISDCIVFLEVEKGARVPDSSMYKIESQSGLTGYKKI